MQQKIIQSRYDETEQLLYLGNYFENQKDCYKVWQDVLKYRDWSMIKMLDIFQCGINDDNIGVILKLHWPQLTSLYLSNEKLTAKGVQQLLNKVWPKLQIFSLGSNQIGDQGFMIIIENLPPKLNFLCLSQCGISGIGIKALVNHNHTKLANLKSLILGSNIIGNVGIKWLTKCSFTNLQKFGIQNCQVREEGHKHLIKAKWPNLQSLWLTYIFDLIAIRVKLQIWQMIHENEWRKLTSLSIYETQPICCLNFVLVQSGGINKYYINIKNEILSKLTIEIFTNRAILI